MSRFLRNSIPSNKSNQKNHYYLPEDDQFEEDQSCETIRINNFSPQAKIRIDVILQDESTFQMQKIEKVQSHQKTPFPSRIKQHANSPFPSRIKQQFNLNSNSQQNYSKSYYNSTAYDSLSKGKQQLTANRFKMSLDNQPITHSSLQKKQVHAWEIEDYILKNRQNHVQNKKNGKTQFKSQLIQKKFSEIPNFTRTEPFKQINPFKQVNPLKQIRQKSKQFQQNLAKSNQQKIQQVQSMDTIFGKLKQTSKLYGKSKMVNQAKSSQNQEQLHKKKQCYNRQDQQQQNQPQQVQQFPYQQQKNLFKSSQKNQTLNNLDNSRRFYVRSQVSEEYFVDQQKQKHQSDFFKLQQRQSVPIRLNKQDMQKNKMIYANQQQKFNSVQEEINSMQVSGNQNDQQLLQYRKRQKPLELQCQKINTTVKIIQQFNNSEIQNQNKNNLIDIDIEIEDAQLRYTYSHDSLHHQKQNQSQNNSQIIYDKENNSKHKQNDGNDKTDEKEENASSHKNHNNSNKSLSYFQSQIQDQNIHNLSHSKSKQLLGIEKGLEIDQYEQNSKIEDQSIVSKQFQKSIQNKKQMLSSLLHQNNEQQFDFPQQSYQHQNQYQHKSNLIKIQQIQKQQQNSKQQQSNQNYLITDDQKEQQGIQNQYSPIKLQIQDQNSQNLQYYIEDFNRNKKFDHIEHKDEEQQNFRQPSTTNYVNINSNSTPQQNHIQQYSQNHTKIQENKQKQLSLKNYHNNSLTMNNISNINKNESSPLQLRYSRSSSRQKSSTQNQKSNRQGSYRKRYQQLEKYKKLFQKKEKSKNNQQSPTNTHQKCKHKYIDLSYHTNLSTQLYRQKHHCFAANQPQPFKHKDYSSDKKISPNSKCYIHSMKYSTEIKKNQLNKQEQNTQISLSRQSNVSNKKINPKVVQINLKDKKAEDLFIKHKDQLLNKLKRKQKQTRKAQFGQFFEKPSNNKQDHLNKINKQITLKSTNVQQINSIPRNSKLSPYLQQLTQRLSSPHTSKYPCSHYIHYSTNHLKQKFLSLFKHQNQHQDILKTYYISQDELNKIFHTQIIKNKVNQMYWIEIVRKYGQNKMKRIKYGAKNIDTIKIQQTLEDMKRTYTKTDFRINYLHQKYQSLC